jgi:hypothetical protein
MQQVRSNVLNALVQYCEQNELPQSASKKPRVLAARDDFDLNKLSLGKNAAWLFNDISNWLTWGALGQNSAYLFGSFRLAWYAKPKSCDNGLGSAEVKFYAWDVAHLGSAVRVPKTSVPLINIGDQPLGPGRPLNDVPIAWYWSTQYIFSYPSLRVQPKLETGTVDDPLELEADRVPTPACPVPPRRRR